MASHAAKATSLAQTSVEESLRREHEFAENLVNTAQTIVLVLDLQGRIVRFNPYMECISGWRIAEVQGKDWFETFLPERDRESIQALFGRAIKGHRTRCNVNPIVTRDGHERDIEWFDAPLTCAKGELIGLLCTGQDVTDRKRVEEALQQSEERIRAIFNAASDAIITIDRRGVIDDLNPATEEMFGYARGELIGQNVKMLMPSPYCDEHDGYIARYFRTGEARIIGSGREVVGRHKDGETFPIDLAVSEIDHMQMFTGIIRDISDRKALQEHLLTIAAEEQQRIGQDLHDGVGPEVLAMGMVAGTLIESVERLPSTAEIEPILRMGRGLKSSLNTCLRQVRALSRGLIPVQIDAHGLTSALADLARQIGQLHGVDCKFVCSDVVTLTDSTAATHLYRIAQEAVTNALKHGKAHRIQIGLEGRDDQLALHIEDDGAGIPEPVPVHAGMGLRTMNYRANLIGARLKVEPRKNGGTVVSCHVSKHLLKGKQAAEGLVR